MVGIRSLNCDLWICFHLPTGCLSFLSQWWLLPPYLSHFVSWELDLATVRLEGPLKYGRTEMWVALHLWLGSYQVLPPLKGIIYACFSFVSFRAALDLGRVVSFVPSLWMPFVSMGLLHPARNIYCLSQLKRDKIFKRSFLLFLKGFFFFF